jgi:hypothetical protein
MTIPCLVVGGSRYLPEAKLNHPAAEIAGRRGRAGKAQGLEELVLTPMTRTHDLDVNRSCIDGRSLGIQTHSTRSLAMDTAGMIGHEGGDVRRPNLLGHWGELISRVQPSTHS